MKSHFYGMNTSAVSTSATNYNYMLSNGNAAWAVSEANREQVVPHAMTLDQLRVSVTTAPGTGKNYAITLMVNGVASALTTSIVDTSTGNNDLVDAVSLNAGDTISIQWTPTGTPTAPGIVYWSVRQDASNAFAVIGCNVGAPTSGTNYFNPMARVIVSATDALAGIIVPTAGTLQNLYLFSNGAPGAGTSWTFTLMLNNVAQSLTAAISGTGTTGNDVAHSVSVSAGDLISLQIVAGGTPVAKPVAWGMTFNPTNDGESFIGQSGAVTAATGATQYDLIHGGDTAWVNAASENTRYLKVGATTIKAFYATTSVTPGVSPKSYTYTVDNSSSATAATVTINDASTTVGTTRVANITGLSIAIAHDDPLTIKSAPNSTPATVHVKTSILFFIPPPSSPIASLQIPNKMVGPQVLRFNFRQPYNPPITVVAANFYTQSFNGTLNLAGNLTKQTLYPLSGAINFSGNLAKAIFRSFSANFALAGNLAKIVNRTITGTFNLAGALSKLPQRILSGTFNLTGALSRLVLYPLSGTLNLTGNLNKLISRKLTGSLSLSGSIGKMLLRPLTGTFNLAGSLSKQVGKSLGGTFNLSGALKRLISRSLGGTINFSGSLTRLVTRSLTGTLNLAGSLVGSHLRLTTLTGTLNLAGALTKQPQKALSGTINFTGNITRLIARGLSGSLSLSGNLAKSVTRKLTGALAVSGNLITAALHSVILSGSLNLSGNLKRQTNRLLGGTLNPTGSLTRLITRSLSGSLNLAGLLSKLPKRTLIGTLNLTGVLSKQVLRTLTGNLSLVGNISRNITRALAGALGLVGNTTKSVARTFTANLSLGGFLTSIYRALVHPTRPQPIDQNKNVTYLDSNPNVLKMDQKKNTAYIDSNPTNQQKLDSNKGTNYLDNK